MQQTAFILSLALAVKTSLLSHLAEGLMKTLWYLALYLIQVAWMKFVFPSHLSDKGFTTTSAYYWSKETLRKRDSGLTFIGPDLDALLQVHRRKKYIVLKMSTFPDIKGIIFFSFFLFFVFSFLSSSSSSMYVTVSENIQILKLFTGFLKTSPNDFSSLKILFSCWPGTKPPKPSGHSSIHTQREGKISFNTLKIQGQSASNTRRGSWKKWFMDRTSSQSSLQDLEDAQRNMEHKHFPAACVWERSGELEKEGKLYQGERLTMTRCERYLKKGKGDSSMVIRLYPRLNCQRIFPQRKLGSPVLSMQSLRSKWLVVNWWWEAIQK